MKKIKTLILFAVILLWGSMAFAGNVDQVICMRLNNLGDVGIQMKNAGWVVARVKDVGPENVNRIYAVALTLLNTGFPTGYFNDTLDTDTADQTWGGISNIKEITVLQATRPAKSDIPFLTNN